MNKKKSVLFFLLLCVGITSAYWYFYSKSWGTVINESSYWEYRFQSEKTSSQSKISWKSQKEKLVISDSLKDFVLFLKKGFVIDNPDEIIGGRLLFNHKFSVKIYFNDVECADIDRNLISPQLSSSGTYKIVEYWRPRRVKLSKEMLSKVLKSGKNTITIVLNNLKDFTEINLNNITLSFLTKGKNNDFETEMKIEKPVRVFSESKLPIFRINTYGVPIPDEPKIGAKMIVLNNPLNKPNDVGSEIPIRIERRGTTSQTFAKKSYSVKLYDDEGNKATSSLLELPAAHKWVLYGPFADKSLIRNALTYSLYTDMGNYAPRFHFVNVILNDNYQGVYMLTEKVQIGKSHLNIPPLLVSNEDSTQAKGGYLLQIDRSPIASIYPPKNDSSTHPTHFEFFQPKAKKINKKIQEKIISQYYEFEKSLYHNNNIYEYFDVKSFIDYLIITEVSKNIDGYRLSTFIYNPNINTDKPKFYIGPIWDYNFSFGLPDYHNGYKTEGYVYNIDNYVPFWWHTLTQDSSFNYELKNRYVELRKTALSDQNINIKIDSLSNICYTSVDDNFTKWPVLNSEDFWPNYFVGKTYQEEINYLKDWIKKRLKFLDQDILAKNGKTSLFFEVSIYNNDKWMDSIKKKAKERKITIEEMVQRDAKYMTNKQD